MSKKSRLAIQSSKIGNKSLVLYIRHRSTQIFKKLQEQHLLLIWLPILLSIDRGPGVASYGILWSQAPSKPELIWSRL
jgi:hypothetical protein